jgi:RimJ/RimL family protein N-acetyltransferase
VSNLNGRARSITGRSGYRCMPRPTIAHGRHAVRAVEPAHIEAIRQWRNAQMDVLRQSQPTSHEQQVAYYTREIWPAKEDIEPTNILLVYLVDDRPIGYGGLVHIDWPGKHAEVSFLLDPALTTDREIYRDHQLRFLALIQELAFDDLGFDYLTTETYAHREAHITNLEAAGFVRTEVLPLTVQVNRIWTDSIMHRCDRPAAKE